MPHTILGSDRPPIEKTHKVLESRAVDPEPWVRLTLVVRKGSVTNDFRRKLSEFATANSFRLLLGPVDHVYHLYGRLGSLADAFGADLKDAKLKPGGEFHRVRSGKLTVEADMPEIEAVLGFDQRPAFHCYAIKSRKFEGEVPSDSSPASNASEYTPMQVASLYNFPKYPQSDGAKTRAAIVELGGAFSQSDFDSYLKKLGLTVHPKINVVLVDGATSSSDGPDGADGEVMLDVEVLGSIARGAHIDVYFAPNTEQGFFDALAGIPAQTDVVSISWGGPEDTWTKAGMVAMDSALQDLASRGITTCVASGDNGSSDGENGKHADFPASSPHCLSCGGTSLTSAADGTMSEVVWNNGGDGGASGGGFSSYFKKPAYQSTIKGSHRGIPDVAGSADPQRGYIVLVDGQTHVFGGTSAVAPLWAALLLLAMSINGKRSFAPPLMYSHKPTNDIVEGNNGAFKAAVGWDPITGLGSPKGEAVVAAMR